MQLKREETHLDRAMRHS